MNRYLLLLFIIAGTVVSTASASPSEQAVDQASQKLLKTVVREFANSPEASPYFREAKTDSISLQYSKGLVNSPQGWEYDWNYAHDVSFVPDPETQAGNHVAYNSPSAIRFHVSLAYSPGTGKVLEGKRYTASTLPPVQTAFLVTTGKGEIDSRLEKTMDKIMTANLIIFRKALAGAE